MNRKESEPGCMSCTLQKGKPENNMSNIATKAPSSSNVADIQTEDEHAVDYANEEKLRESLKKYFQKLRARAQEELNGESGEDTHKDDGEEAEEEIKDDVNENVEKKTEDGVQRDIKKVIRRKMAEPTEGKLVEEEGDAPEVVYKAIFVAITGFWAMVALISGKLLGWYWSG